MKNPKNTKVVKQTGHFSLKNTEFQKTRRHNKISNIEINIENFHLFDRF